MIQNLLSSCVYGFITSGDAAVWGKDSPQCDLLLIYKTISIFLLCCPHAQPRAFGSLKDLFNAQIKCPSCICWIYGIIVFTFYILFSLFLRFKHQAIRRTVVLLTDHSGRTFLILFTYRFRGLTGSCPKQMCFSLVFYVGWLSMVPLKYKSHQQIT